MSRVKPIRFTVTQNGSEKVYGGKPQTVRFRVWPTQAHMLVDAYGCDVAGIDDDTVGVTICEDDKGRYVDGSWRAKHKKHGATIYLTSSWLKMSVLSHEVSHATIGLLRRSLGWDFPLGAAPGDNEEAVCYVLGDLLASSMQSLREHGLVFRA